MGVSNFLYMAITLPVYFAFTLCCSMAITFIASKLLNKLTFQFLYKRWGVAALSLVWYFICLFLTILLTWIIFYALLSLLPVTLSLSIAGTFTYIVVMAYVTSLIASFFFYRWVFKKTV